MYRKLGPKGLDPYDDCNSTLRKSCTVDVYLMLIGYAIENILKGILVRGVTRGRRHSLIPMPELPKELKCHNVLSLAVDAGFTLTSLEKDLLERMEEIVVWRGRYHAPIKSQDIKGFHRRSNDLVVLQTFLEKIRRKKASYA